MQRKSKESAALVAFCMKELAHILLVRMPLPLKAPTQILAVLLACCALGPVARAQSKPTQKSPLCTRDNALAMVKDQIDLTRTFSISGQRITVLIRAADLLWPHQQDRARLVFTEAFKIATEQEKENDQKSVRSVILRLQSPDQRYVVIRAIAKRDPRWAQELTRQMLKDASSTKDSFNDVLTEERLLEAASKLIPMDISAALDLANASLNYAASAGLTRFLYQLAAVDQRAADDFYARALSVYGGKPMREFLYLQAYPFRLHNSLNTPIFAFYQAPQNFVTNPVLQRQFAAVLLRRAKQALDEPYDESDAYRDPSGMQLPGTVNLVQSMMQLEPRLSESVPDLVAELTQVREKLLVSLSLETQKLLRQPGREVSSVPTKTFDEEIDGILKLPNVNQRDELIAAAVLSDKSDSQPLDRVVEVIEKINDANIRTHLPEPIYFRRAVIAIDAKQLDDALKLTAKVDGLEQRAYLHTRIAKALLNNLETQTQARDLLDEAVTEAAKAGPTIFVARTLLTASSLYMKIDLSRSISLLLDAINCINHLESPDFSSDDQAQVKKLQRVGKPGQHLLRFYMPGADAESVFREMAKIDFDTALSQSSALTDKFQRALSTLALAEVCLNKR